MAQFGYPKLKIELDSAGDALQDISTYVTAINGWTVERLLEELTAAGDVNDRWADIGFTQKSEVQLSGPYDDTANGLVALVKAWNDGSLRGLRMTFDVGTNADIQNVECLLAKWSRNPSKGKLTQFVATLRPTGVIATA